MGYIGPNMGILYLQLSLAKSLAIIPIPLLLYYFVVSILQSTFNYTVLFPLTAPMLRWVEERLSLLAVEEIGSHKK